MKIFNENDIEISIYVFLRSLVKSVLRIFIRKFRLNIIMFAIFVRNKDF
jgi:hypothetical protein